MPRNFRPWRGPAHRPGACFNEAAADAAEFSWMPPTNLTLITCFNEAAADAAEFSRGRPSAVPALMLLQ